MDTILSFSSDILFGMRCKLLHFGFVCANFGFAYFLCKRFSRCPIPSCIFYFVNKTVYNCSIRNKNCLWRSYLLTDQDEILQSLQRTFHRSFLPSFGSFGQTVSEENIFLEINQIEPKIACGVAAMCVTGSGKKIAIFIEDLLQMLPTKFRLIRTTGFRGEYFIQKSTNQKQELPVAAMFINGSGQNMQSLQRTICRCVLLSFGSFRDVVTEEKMFIKRSI